MATRNPFQAGLCGALLLLAPAHAGAAELKQETIRAFDRYAAATEARIDGELKGRVPFLWLDRQGEGDRARSAERLRSGEVVISALETRAGGAGPEAPDGLIHHWIGTVLLPGVPLDRAIAMVQSYEQYDRIYHPAVRQARTLSRSGNTFRVRMQLFMKKVVSVLLNTDYDVTYLPLGPRRMHVRSYTRRIAEVAHDGTREIEKPVGQDSGYLWRFYNYCSFEERAEGTYMQCESISLSRDIPPGLGWLIRPFVTSIPRESLTNTLTAARRWLLSS
jgi:hypothetical protein